MIQNAAMSKDRKLIIANWKMNCLLSDSAKLARNINYTDNCDVVLCPPFTAIHRATETRKDARIKLGAQDCHYSTKGAFTGDISPAMLRDIGCDYVILGHSERRQHHSETSALVNSKATAAHNAGLIAVVCVGESLEERDNGKTLEILENQIIDSIPDTSTKDNTIIAYEPVWAIGTGKTPTPAQIEDAHKFIIKTVNKKIGFKTRVLYGGSVKAENAASILNIDGVSGFLVGGASLDTESFNNIIKAT